MDSEWKHNFKNNQINKGINMQVKLKTYGTVPVLTVTEGISGVTLPLGYEDLG